MRGIKINFGDSGPVFDLVTQVSGFQSTFQNAIVNVATRVGTDPIYSDRGTRLVDSAVKGAMINTLWATHIANFAALQTLSFIRKSDDTSNLFRMQSFKLQAAGLQNQHVQLLAGATSVYGENLGTTALI